MASHFRFTRISVECQLAALASIKKAIGDDPPTTELEVGDLLEASFRYLPLNPEIIAADLSVHLDTVLSWVSRTQVPDRRYWAGICQSICRIADQRHVDFADANKAFAEMAEG